MVTAELERHAGMAKRPGRPKTESGPGASVKIDATIKSRAEMVASNRSVTLTEYLSSILNEPVARDFLQEMKRIESESKSKRSPGGSES